MGWDSQFHLISKNVYFTEVFLVSDEYNFQFEEPTNNENNNNEQEFDLNSFSSSATTEAVIKKKKKKSGKQRILKIILTVFLVGIITCSIIVGSFAVYVFTMVDNTMDVDLNDLKLNFTTTVYIDDGSGEYIEYTRLHGMYDRIWMNYDRTKAEKNEEGYTGIPQNLVDAFIAIEDKRFGTHTGTDWRRTFSAFANMIFNFSDSNFGGSTITQQLVKNLTDDDDRSASRKIREIMRARYLEEHYSKDVIIECYLNTIAMGHGTYGVEAAAKYYFDKTVSELTLTECAALAAITKSPSYYAPDTNPKANLERRKSVLYEMYDQGYITKKEYNAAIKEDLQLVEFVEEEKEIYSYYIDALIDQVVNDLVDKYNYDKKAANLMFFSGGYKIYATLDPNVQAALESVYTDSKTYGLVAKDGAMMQGAMTVMDYNGNVKGLVGGIGEKVENRGLNRATDAVRQPGSTIKPLSAYSLAIEKNLINYSSILNDTATNYNGWKPVNWYGSYTGNITAAYALERSVNTIPVYLVNKMKPQTSYDFLTKKLGISTLTSEDVNLSPMGMGGTNGGITTLESAAAFAMFGNNGLYYEPHLYTKVLDQKNEVILSYEDITPTVAITEDTATIMNHMLQNVVYSAQGTAAGAGNYIPQMKFFAKTGTTNDQKDLWFVGGTPYYVASAWCGYDIQQNISTSSIAQKMWGAAMSKIHKDLEAKEFVDSEYVVKRYYCTQTGSLATDACPSKGIGWYKKTGLPSKCQTHDGAALDAPKYNSDQEEKANASQEADNSASEDNTAE